MIILSCCDAERIFSASGPAKGNIKDFFFFFAALGLDYEKL